jgi:hypothetical protein
MDSVLELAAKPIVDTDIVVADESEIRPVIDAPAAVGYQRVGDLGVEGREALDTSPHPEFPRSNSPWSSSATRRVWTMCSAVTCSGSTPTPVPATPS